MILIGGSNHMIYVTGDIHGYSGDIKKLTAKNVTSKLTKNDYLIICGDFGLVWDTKHETMKEKMWIKWLQDQAWTTLFVDGNHECFPRLYTYPEKDWNGGKVHEIRSKILHLERGYVFELEGKKIFTLGGATSHDRGPATGDMASVGKYWWPEELPSAEEFARATASLDACGRKVDYIITHCLPTKLQDVISNNEYFNDALTDYLQGLVDTVEYDHWYCGHYHVDRAMTDKITVLFNSVLEIGSRLQEVTRELGVPIYKKGKTVRFMYNGSEEKGQIVRVMPWGNPAKKGEPCYNIQFLNSAKQALMVKESDIIDVA